MLLVTKPPQPSPQQRRPPMFLGLAGPSAMHSPAPWPLRPATSPALAWVAAQLLRWGLPAIQAGEKRVHLQL